VPSYVVEIFLAHGLAAELPALERRARTAAEQLTGEGSQTAFAGAIHLLEDEICFFQFDAASEREAIEVARRAGLDPLRVVEAAVTHIDTDGELP
jgi:hypothetical protein